MENEEVTEIDWMRQLYIEDLSKTVTYGLNTRTRVAHPGKWDRLDTIIGLNESVAEPMIIPPLDPSRKVWIWSDQHFSHKNIIRFSERPFADVTEMDEHLIANHNEYVGKNDICLWLGDVGFKGTNAINEMLNRCNGYNILVIGNHDFNGKKLRNLAFDETHMIYMVEYPDVSMVMTHYPMYNLPAPWINVHGHLHAYPTPFTGQPQHINVNCEIQDYRPRLLDEVAVDAKKAAMRVIASKM